MRRGKVGVLLLAIAAGTWYLGRLFWPEAEAEDASRITSVTCYTIAGVTALMALGVIILGRIKLTGLFIIDLRGEKPAFKIGLPFMRLSISTEQQKGCMRVPGTRLFMLAPFLLRFVLKGGLAFIPVHLLHPEIGWMYAGCVGAGAFTGLYVLDRWIHGVLAPKEIEGSDSDKKDA